LYPEKRNDVVKIHKHDVYLKQISLTKQVNKNPGKSQSIDPNNCLFPDKNNQ